MLLAISMPTHSKHYMPKSGIKKTYKARLSTIGSSGSPIFLGVLSRCYA